MHSGPQHHQTHSKPKRHFHGLKGRPQVVHQAKDAVRDLLRLGLTFTEIQKQTKVNYFYLVSIFNRLGIEPSQPGGMTADTTTPMLQPSAAYTPSSVGADVTTNTNAGSLLTSSVRSMDQSVAPVQLTKFKTKFGTDRWSHCIDFEVEGYSDDDDFELYHKPVSVSPNPVSLTLQAKLDEIRRLNEKLKNLETAKKSGVSSPSMNANNTSSSEMVSSPLVSAVDDAAMGTTSGAPDSTPNGAILEITAELDQLKNEAILAVDEKQHELDQKEYDVKSKINALHERLDHYSNQSKTLQQDIAELTSKLVETTSRLDKVESEKKVIRQSIEEMENDLNKVQGALSRLHELPEQVNEFDDREERKDTRHKKSKKSAHDAVSNGPKNRQVEVIELIDSSDSEAEEEAIRTEAKQQKPICKVSHRR